MFPEPVRFSFVFGQYFNQVVSVEYCTLNSFIQERLHFVQTLYRSTVKMIFVLDVLENSLFEDRDVGSVLTSISTLSKLCTQFQVW